MLTFPHILGLIVLTTELSSTTSQKRSEHNCLLKGKLEVYIFIVLIVTSVVYNAVVDTILQKASGYTGKLYERLPGAGQVQCRQGFVFDLASRG